MDGALRMQDIRARSVLQGSKKKRSLRKRPPRWLPPAAAERSYRRELDQSLSEIHAAYAKHLLPRLPALAREASAHQPGDSTRGDAWPDAVASLMNEMRNTLAGRRKNYERISGLTAAETSAWNRTQWNKITSSVLGVDVIKAEPWLQPHLKSWAVENASLIKSLEESAVAEVEKWTLKGLRTGMRHEEIAGMIEERFEVSASRAKFIARDQVSKLNGSLTKERQTQVGVTEYIWRTVGDERVRPSHKRLDGKTIAWNSPPAVGHPGQDFQCRCSSEPVLSGLLAGLEE